MAWAAIATREIWGTTSTSSGCVVVLEVVLETSVAFLVMYGTCVVTFRMWLTVEGIVTKVRDVLVGLGEENSSESYCSVSNWA